jgi:hypothetical protein
MAYEISRAAYVEFRDFTRSVNLFVLLFAHHASQCAMNNGTEAPVRAGASRQYLGASFADADAPSLLPAERARRP